MQTIKWFQPNQVSTEIHAAEISDLAGILSAGRQEIDFPSEKKTFFVFAKVQSDDLMTVEVLEAKIVLAA